ncbi:TraB/GumN family protein [Herbaspirillum sp. NPDC087042]|uniref:TraB/GumN family protein n=1 Tax=Herbaspirillum sp. NPDC087042 TaxID=3364004 RepID=UPI0037F1693F
MPEALAQVPSAPTPAGPHAAPPRGALYQISDGHHTLLLFGTIHVGAADFYPLEPRLAQALAEAPVLALELDPGNAVALQAAVRRHALYPDGQRFQDQLDPALTQRTLAALQRYQLPLAPMQAMRPWMLAMALTVQAYEQHGYHAELAVDSYLANAVRQHGGQVMELESAERQMGIFSRLNGAQQAQFLKDSLDELEDDDLTRKLDELVGAWRHADSAGFAAALKELRDDDSFSNRFTLQALLEERNPGLADGIASLLRKNDQAIAAIGILHLIGPDGVPALLARKGLQVRQLY